MMRIAKFILISVILLNPFSGAWAAKKADAIYTGPAIIFKPGSAWDMNELEKCFRFNRRNFENEVAKYSWEDFKNLKSGMDSNTGCHNRSKAQNIKKTYESSLEDLKNYVLAMDTSDNQGFSLEMSNEATSEDDAKKYNDYFLALDRSVKRQLNRKTKTYPGFNQLKLRSPNRVFAACIDWAIFQKNFSGRKFEGAFNFGIAWNNILSEAKISALNSCEEGNSEGQLFCDCELVAVNETLFIDNLVQSKVTQEKPNERGWLGVFIQEVTNKIANEIGLNDTKGALVANIAEDGPADRAGFKLNDVIVKFNGTDVEETRQLPKLVSEAPVGVAFEVEVIRQQQIKRLYVSLETLTNIPVSKQGEETPIPTVQNIQTAGPKAPTDTRNPSITIASTSSNGRRGTISGTVKDNAGIAELRVDGEVVPLKSDGSFEWQGFIPAGGKSVTIEAIDTAGLSTTQRVRLERGQQNKASGPLFAELNPFRGKAAKKNRDALAIIVGVSDYKRTSDPAIYADRDAQYFQDYAALKLGIPDNQIFSLVNDEADKVEITKAVKNWLLRMSAKDKTDVYVFFAGHGLASSDGSNMFLLPYDGDPELLEDSAIDRKQLFADIQAISPRSVTVFLDSCYSGGTRAGGTLVASLRPIAIRAKEQNVPDGFTILSAAKGDQTSQSLEEAKHGLFSYFLMRGLEGDADANNDNQITAGELHSFVTDKVERQSGFKQTPDLQGDADRVLVRFQ